MIPAGSGPTRIRLILSRLGGRPVVLKTLEQSENEGNGPLNNSVETEESYPPKAGTRSESEILCARFYPSDPDAEESGSGTVTQDHPRLAFPSQDVTVVPEEEDRVEYDGVVYELGAPKRYTNYVTFEAQNVND